MDFGVVFFSMLGGTWLGVHGYLIGLGNWEDTGKAPRKGSFVIAMYYYYTEILPVSRIPFLFVTFSRDTYPSRYLLTELTVGFRGVLGFASGSCAGTGYCTLFFLACRWRLIGNWL